VVYAIKEFSYIAFEDITRHTVISAYFEKHPIYHIHAFVATFSDPTGKRCGNKGRFKYRIQDTESCMMKYSVADRSFVNMTTFGIGDEKAGVGIMSIRHALQLPIKLKYIWFKPHLKLKNIRAGPFASLEFFP
jgi:hypothetical protein